MLINVFGKWINPDNITTLDDWNDGVLIYWNSTVDDEDDGSMMAHTFIQKCSINEVANVINKQLLRALRRQKKFLNKTKNQTCTVTPIPTDDASALS